jgi:8-oxo-dGTP pyrophosphatase MutT (NUDIX family)
MAQTYEVFIGDGRICFADDAKNATNNSSIISNPNKEELINSIVLLERRRANEIWIVGDVKSNWENFNSAYHLIEAAGGLVSNSEGLWLFIHRNGKWDLPKGKLESFEQPEEAGTREVSEECGICEPDLEKELVRTYHTYSQHGQRVLKRTYWYLMNYKGNEEPKPQKEEGIDEVIWVEKDEIPRLLEDCFPSIIRVVEAAFLLPN